MRGTPTSQAQLGTLYPSHNRLPVSASVANALSRQPTHTEASSSDAPSAASATGVKGPKPCRKREMAPSVSSPAEMLTISVRSRGAKRRTCSMCASWSAFVSRMLVAHGLPYVIQDVSTLAMAPPSRLATLAARSVHLEPSIGYSRW